MAGIFVLEFLMQLSCNRALATHASNKFDSENFSVPDFLGGVTSFKFHIPHTDLFFATKLIYLKHSKESNTVEIQNNQFRKCELTH